MHRSTRHHRALALTFSAALLASACSGGSSEQAASPTTASPKPGNGSSAGDSASKPAPIAKASIKFGAAGDPADASAGDAAAAAYTPTDALIADSGFRPEKDSFSIPNYGGSINDTPAENLTAAEMRKLYGDGVCVDTSAGRCDLNPMAQQAMEEMNQSMSGGHCYGFSVASMMFWKKQFNSADFGADTTPALVVPGNAQLQHQIAYGFAFQYLQSVSEQKISGTPTEMLAKLKEVLTPETSEVYTIGFFKRDGGGGHAVTPYAIEDKGSGKYAILIYDNNYPGVTRAISVDTNADTWSYSASINPNEPSELYEGDASTKSLGLYPTNPALSTQPCPFCGNVPGSTSDGGPGRSISQRSVGTDADSMDQIFLEGSTSDHAHLLIENSDGKRTGYLDGKLVNEIPGARVALSLNNQTWKDDIEPDYFVPDGDTYTITIDGKGLVSADETTVGVIGPSFDVEVDGLVMDPGQTDTLAFAQYATKVAYTSGGSESPTITVGFSDDAADYSFDAQGVEIDPGSTFGITLPLEGSVFSLSNVESKATATYSFGMTKYDETGVEEFRHDDLGLEPGDTAGVDFDQWDNGEPVAIVVDHNGTKTTIEATDEES
jgi:hypothetical protein